MLPWISIVIPTFQGGRYLEQAIQSILSQGYPALELIVIDGGSTDNSLEIIKKYEKSLAYWVSEPDDGQSDAINKGFARATGELVTFLSNDDSYAPGALLDVAERWQQNSQVGAIIGAFQFMDENGQGLSEPVLPALTHPAPLDMTLLHPSGYRLHQVSTFYARRALEGVGFWVRVDLRYVMDRDLLYRVARSFPLELFPRVYGLFRKHPQSKSEHAILPFAEEFASLYLNAMDGHPAHDRLRARHARYFRASGWLKLAKARPQILTALPALLRALALWPAFLFQYSYWAGWKRLLAS